LYLYKGDRGIFQARKHLTWYATGFPGASELRTHLQAINSVAEGVDLLDRQIELFEARKLDESRSG
jgi:tRNA-dihydrouridine synthase B